MNHLKGYFRIRCSPTQILMCITRLFPIMQLKMLHMLGSLHNFRFKENLKTIPVHKIKLGKKKIILANTM